VEVGDGVQTVVGITLATILTLRVLVVAPMVRRVLVVQLVVSGVVVVVITRMVVVVVGSRVEGVIITPGSTRTLAITDQRRLSCQMQVEIKSQARETFLVITPSIMEK
jgi:hypothetical protein